MVRKYINQEGQQYTGGESRSLNIPVSGLCRDIPHRLRFPARALQDGLSAPANLFGFKAQGMHPPFLHF